VNAPLHALIGFMVYMFINYLFLKGMSFGSGFGILEKGIIPYYNDVLHASGAQLNLAAGTISPLAYSVKPLMALLVDTFPIWGYHKRYYVVITACLAVICNLLLALLPADASWADASLALAFLFAVPVFECALTDLICEGVYARVMRENPDSSADIPTYANTIVNLGGLIAPQLVGHLADTKGPKFVFFIGAVFGAPIVIPALLGWQPEKKVPQKGTFCWCGKPAYDSLKANWRIMLCGFIIGMLALAQAIISAIIGDEGLGVYPSQQKYRKTPFSIIIIIIIFLRIHCNMLHELICICRPSYDFHTRNIYRSTIYRSSNLWIHHRSI
jgi:MFS family permease